MKKILIVALALAPTVAFASREDVLKRMNAAGNTFQEIMDTPDRGIPRDLLDKAQCVGIIPSLKRAGFIVGAKYGKGVLVCRTATGWSGPATVIVEGGSFGLQIGAGETDLVFVVMNRSGEEKLMQDKFTFGGDAAAMAGPVGRSAEAQTDAMLHAEILSWSRARGVFAGISLDGSTLRPDQNDNADLFGRPVTQREILRGEVQRPAGTDFFYSELHHYMPAQER